MIEFLHALDLNLLIGLFCGLVVGSGLGFALGHDSGRLEVIDAMRDYADAQTEQPVATWERMRTGTERG